MPLRMQAARARIAPLLVTAMGLASACRRPSSARSVAARPASRPVGGLYWGRLAEVPDGMRVQVWLDADATRVRGSYVALPYNGEIEGRLERDGAVALTVLETGVTRAVGARVRHATLRWDARGALLAGEASDGTRIELVRAGFPSPRLRPGLWISRWTGLPAGMGVETRIARDPDGHYRAVYQYQGGGGLRDGAFDATLGPDGALDVAWRELVAGSPLAAGRASLLPAPFGLRGSYGIEGSAEGTGEWALEPLGP